jgi:hypothetical protein
MADDIRGAEDSRPAGLLTLGSSTDDVVAWLKTLPGELAKYEAAVRAGRFTGHRVLTTPVQDLFELLGVTSAGHKHLLRKALAALASPASLVGAPPAASGSELPPVKGQLSSTSLVLDAALTRVTAESDIAPCVLSSPAETEDWIVLREGPLVARTEGKKRSETLRWCVLKEEPDTFDTTLEMYDMEIGRLLAAFRLNDSIIKPEKRQGAFSVSSLDNLVEFSSLGANVRVATLWLLALQMASQSARSRSRFTFSVLNTAIARSRQVALRNASPPPPTLSPPPADTAAAAAIRAAPPAPMPTIADQLQWQALEHHDFSSASAPSSDTDSAITSLQALALEEQDNQQVRRNTMVKRRRF